MIQSNPEIARSIAGVFTLQEKDDLERTYKKQMDIIQAEFFNINLEVSKLQTIKNRLVEIATPVVIKSQSKALDGAGGPYNPIMLSQELSGGSLISNLQALESNGKILKALIKNLETEWEQQYQLVAKLPTAFPIREYPPRSDYGPRVDPITKKMAQHFGVDFPAPPGTPIFATANGVVDQVGADQEYGLFITINHATGFVTKYAHASKVFVQHGQTIYRGDKIAEVGSSGRSTGPHLHYEVRLNGALINPAQVFLSNKTKVIQNNALSTNYE